VIVVFLDNSTRHFETIFASSKEVEVCHQVIVLNSKAFFVLRDFDGLKNTDSLDDSVLEL
jgi:methyltransferase-like protein